MDTPRSPMSSPTVHTNTGVAIAQAKQVRGKGPECYALIIVNWGSVSHLAWSGAQELVHGMRTPCGAGGPISARTQLPFDST